MAKISKPKVQNHTFLKLIIAILILGGGLLILKYIKVKEDWREHAVALTEGIQKYEFLDQVEDAQVLSAIATQIPSVGNPIISSDMTLQRMITVMSAKTERNIVVVDKNKKILADTIASRVGQTYAEDKNGEISKTLFDGVPRSFIEKDADFPDGISQTVVQMKDANGTIIGAVIITSSNIFK
ncbi:MAG: hypothetical protein ACM3IJ_01200 [Candidatus Levyibacteriota bacterium]